MQESSVSLFIMTIFYISIRHLWKKLLSLLKRIGKKLLPEKQGSEQLLIKMCLKCGEKGHKANACPKAQKMPFEKRKMEIKERFFTKRTKATWQLNSTIQWFSFHASDKREGDSHFELLIDSACTSHMIKDIELFSYVETSQKRKGFCANGTESVVEGRDKIEFFAKNSWGTLQNVALENNLHDPQYSQNLIATKRLNVAEAKVLFDEKPRIVIENDCFFKESWNNLFFLRATKFEVSNTSEDTQQLWHERSGHNNKMDIRKISRHTENWNFWTETTRVMSVTLKKRDVVL